MLLMLTYVFGGLLHGLTDVSVFSSPLNTVVLTSADSNDGQSDKGIAAEHHCHGCFAVSIPVPPQASVRIEQRATTSVHLEVDRRNLALELDTPPPKSLT